MQRERKKWARVEKRKKEGRTTNAVEGNMPATGIYSGKYSSLPPLNNSYREILHETRGFDPVPAPVTQ